MTRATSKENAAGNAHDTVAGKAATGRKAGWFITFEGGEGSGKTSQVKRLAERLRAAGHTVRVTREPGGSPGAEAVRHVLLSGAAEPFGSEMEAILFAASRADHVERVIRPALKNGEIVLSDRFFDSTRVYQGESGQGEGGRLDPALLRQLERVACGDTIPDLTLILDLDPQEGMRRAAARRDPAAPPDRFEKESLAAQRQRRAAYLKIAEQEPQRCRVIDASGDEQEVFERVWSAVEAQFESKAGERAADSLALPMGGGMPA